MSDAGTHNRADPGTNTDDITINDAEGPYDSHDKDVKGEKEASIEPENVVQRQNSDIPDGGLRAWLVVLGASCGTFATFGYVNAWGVFQSYYEEQVLPTTSPSTIAWIGSIEYALIFIPGLLTGRLYDMGYVKVPISIASATLVTSTFLVAECKTYWQLVLCQGILSGISCGVIFGPMMGVVAHWFKKKRGLALGIIAVGSSIGGTIFPIAARNLTRVVGFKWMMRTLGFIQLAALGITCLTVARRLPPSKIPAKMIDFKIFKQWAYTAYCFAGLITFFGLYTVLTYIDVSAVAAGLSPDFTFYLVSIANAASGFGRFAGGLLADQFGPLNVMIPATLVASVLTYAWPFAQTKGQFVAIAIIYGIFSGVYVSLLTAPIFAMGDAHNVGIMVGMAMTILALGAIAGPPISGAINAATDGYKDVGYYAGSMIILSVLIISVVRQLRLGGKLYGKI